MNKLMCKIDKYIHQLCITNDHTLSTDHAKKKRKKICVKIYCIIYTLFTHFTFPMWCQMIKINAQHFFLEIIMSLCILRWCMSNYYTSPLFWVHFSANVFHFSQGQGLQTVWLTGVWCWEVDRAVECSVLESVLLNAVLLACGTTVLQADGSPCLQRELCCRWCCTFESGTGLLDEFWILTGSRMVVDDTQGWVRRWHSVAVTEPSSPWALPSSDKKRAAFWRHDEKPSINWRFSAASTSFAFLAWATEFCKNRTVYSRISAFSILLWVGFCENMTG